MMSVHSMHSVLTSLRRFTHHQEGAGLSDGELLARFLAHRDHDAFEVIVRRHGLMVLGVCRRILHNEFDAEDAFQATFLILAAKAAELQGRELVGDWLHGVACRTALKARAAFALRRRKEQMAAQSEAREPAAWDDLGPLLDEELTRLPDKYRVAIVLCDIEGKTRDEAARALGWPSGTVAGRLARGRALLAGRLASRGVALPAALLVAALQQGTASAQVSAALLASTVNAASRYAAVPIGTGVVSANVDSLVKGALDAMFWTKVKNVAAVSLASILIALLTVAAAYRIADAGASNDARDAAQADDTQPNAKAADDSLPPNAVARFGNHRWRHGEPITYVAYSADGKTLITGGETMVCVWDAASGRELRRFFPAEGAARDSLTALAGVNISRAVHLRGNNRYALSGDGKILAIAYSAGGEIQFNDIATGKVMRRILAPTDKLIGFALSPDGKRAALRTSGRTTIVYDVDTGKPIGSTMDSHRGGAPNGVEAMGLVFTRDGKTIATAEIGRQAGVVIAQVKLIDAATAKEIRTYDVSPDGVTAFALAPDGKTIAVATKGAIEVLDPQTGDMARKIKVAARIGNLAFTPDGKVLAAKGDDAVVRLFDYASGKLQQALGDAKSPAPPISGILRYAPFLAEDLAVAPDGRTLAVGSGSALRLVNIESGKEQFHDKADSIGHRDAVTHFAIAPDGKHLVSRGNDALIRRWNSETRAEISRFAEPRDATSAAFSPDASCVAIGSGDGSIRILATADGKEIHQLQKAHSLGPVRLAFSANGKHLASRSAIDPWIRVYEVATGREVQKITWTIPAADAKRLRFFDASGFAMAFSPDGLTIAAFVQTNPQMLRRPPVAPDALPSIRIWNIATGVEVRKMAPTNDRIVEHLAFSPDGRLLASDNSDQTISLWEVASGQQRALVGAATRIDPSRAPLLGVGPDGRITEGRTRFYGEAIRFSADGRTLASAGVDHSIRIWDTAQGVEIAKLAGHRSVATTLQFSGDGKSLASSSADTTILVWNLASAKPAARKIVELDPGALVRCWNGLREQNAETAGKAANELAASPKSAVAFLQEQLTPSAGVDEKSIQRWVADLSSEIFARRSAAQTELEKAGDLAIPALTKLLASNPAVETRRRAEPLLERLLVGAHSGEQLRILRALEVLENIDTADSGRLLERLADGAAGTPMTRHAQAALARRKARQP